MNVKKTGVTILLLCAIVVMAIVSPSYFSAQASFHSEAELNAFKTQFQTPLVPGEYYLPSTSCKGCHGYDSLQLANVDESGMDVNLFDHWESSMMAMSAKDPFWRAKVSHEILVNPSHANDLQNKCTTCHAPMGRYNAFYHGALNYTLADLYNDTLGLDGVSCAGCHTIDSTVGSTFSGIIPFDTTRQIYGPFQQPFAGPMSLYEGYFPNYGSHTEHSRFCSSCHTLITETVDLNGNYNGNHFVEQATYHEYLNSDYPSLNIQCQTCHMPQLADPIVIANGFAALTTRFPFNQHTFAGSNYFMLNLIKNNKTSIGVDVPDVHFDSTISATVAMLQERSVRLDLIVDSITFDTAYFSVKIENKAGHKFPSGYPSRRAIVEFVVLDANNDTVFKSGTFDNDFRVEGENSGFEPHYNIINQWNVPQLYEMVMGDVNGQFTSVLERADTLLKDNRIPPLGFTSLASMYDTVKVSSDAMNDPDFNKVNTVEGSGIDYVHYHVPVSNWSGLISIRAKVYYQVIPPKWLDEMFSFNSAEIDTFKAMYQASDLTPLAIVSDSLINIPLATNIKEVSYDQSGISVLPSLTADGLLTVTASDKTFIKSIEAFDISGKKVLYLSLPKNTSPVTFHLPSAKGIYYVKIKTHSTIVYKKIVRH